MLRPGGNQAGILGAAPVSQDPVLVAVHQLASQISSLSGVVQSFDGRLFALEHAPTQVPCRPRPHLLPVLLLLMHLFRIPAPATHPGPLASLILPPPLFGPQSQLVPLW
jgi:hypothetical protein